MSLCKVRDAPGKGRGLFVKRACAAGQLLLTETPLLVLCHAEKANIRPEHLFDSFDALAFTGQKAFLSLLDAHQTCGCRWAAPSKNNQDAGCFMAQRANTCAAFTLVPSIMGIWKTNALPLQIRAEPQKTVGRESPRAGTDEETEGAAVFLIVSRINHSCRPSARWLYREDQQKVHVVATQPLRKDQEVTFDYLDSVILPRCERLFRLRQLFHFDCYCSACSEQLFPTSPRLSLSDTRRIRLASVQQALLAAALLPDYDSAVQHAEELETLLDEEGLFDPWHLARSTHTLIQVALVTHRLPDATALARCYYALCLLVEGGDPCAPLTRQAKLYAEDVKAHPIFTWLANKDRETTETSVSFSNISSATL
eukprot:gb/GEZN01006848.1/.p1 GENE.gb/GEZN01006848.1/~~gb/GEZN01006848.1/.p1  ORF type:complete len:368 (+),score=44.76 gb/GEZN01006848.1/:410-1513(+)